MKGLKITFESLADIGKGFIVDFSKISLSGNKPNKDDTNKEPVDNNGNDNLDLPLPDDSVNKDPIKPTDTDTTDTPSGDDNNPPDRPNEDENKGSDTDVPTDTSTNDNPPIPIDKGKDNTVVIRVTNDTLVTVDGLSISIDTSSRSNLISSLKPLKDKGILTTVYKYGVDDYSVILYNNRNQDTVVEVTYSNGINLDTWLHNDSPDNTYRILGNTVEIALSERYNYVGSPYNDPSNSIKFGLDLNNLPVIVFINGEPNELIISHSIEDGWNKYSNNTTQDLNVGLLFPFGQPFGFTFTGNNSLTGHQIGRSKMFWFKLSKSNQSTNIPTDTIATKNAPFSIIDDNLNNAFIRVYKQDRNAIYNPFERSDKFFFDKYIHKNGYNTDELVTMFNATNFVAQKVIDDFSSIPTNSRPVATTWSKPINVEYFINTIKGISPARDGNYYFNMQGDTVGTQIPVFLNGSMTFKEFITKLNDALKSKNNPNRIEVEYFSEDAIDVIRDTEDISYPDYNDVTHLSVNDYS